MKLTLEQWLEYLNKKTGLNILEEELERSKYEIMSSKDMPDFYED